MKISLRSFLPGIAWFFLLLILLVLPGTDLPAMESWMDFFESDKLIHLVLFTLLAYLFMRPIGRSDITVNQKWIYITLIALLTSAWGLATEYIQKHLVTGRSFELMDWAADTIGAVLALIITRIFHMRT